jgi:hypothetical protein
LDAISLWQAKEEIEEEHDVDDEEETHGKKHNKSQTKPNKKSSFL